MRLIEDNKLLLSLILIILCLRKNIYCDLVEKKIEDVLPVPILQNSGCQNGTSCFTKCCPLGYFLFKKSCHKMQNTNFSIQTFNQENPAVEINFPDNFFIGSPPDCATFQLHPEKKSFQEQFYLQIDGRLYIPSENLYIPNNRYCIDNLNFSTSDIFAVVCFDENPSDENIEDVKELFSLIGTIASMPFLLATFIIYCLLPEKNIHAKALMNYVLALFFAYLILTIVKLTDTAFPDFICQIVGRKII